MRRGRQTESSISGMAMPDKREAPYLGRWSSLASHPSSHGAGSSVRPQVDDVICLHHTADRSGTGEHGTGMEACLVSGRDDQDCQRVTQDQHGYSVAYVG